VTHNPSSPDTTAYIAAREAPLALTALASNQAENATDPAAAQQWTSRREDWTRRFGELRTDAAPDPHVWASFTEGIRQLLLGTARPDTIPNDRLTAFEKTGHKLRALREGGELVRVDQDEPVTARRC
jgi:hypothetical protein